MEGKKCSICGKILSGCNRNGKCFHHSYPKDYNPVKENFPKLIGSTTGRLAAKTFRDENGFTVE